MPRAWQNLPIHRKDASWRTMPQVLREPLLELRASLSSLGEQLYSFMNFRERYDAHILGLAVRKSHSPNA